MNNHVVALRKESVDRNVLTSNYMTGPPVALRKESVDRNIGILSRAFVLQASLSARRAWIEMIQKLAHLCLKPVALRKESVDRNDFMLFAIISKPCRSPQGERG